MGDSAESARNESIPEEGDKESTTQSAGDQVTDDTTTEDTSETQEQGGRRWLRRKPKAEKKKRSFWKELPILIGVALLLSILIQTFLARVFVIPSGSMESTLHGCAGCTGDRILVDKVVYAFTDPEPGEVLVFERPESWKSEFTPERSENPVVRWLQGVGALFGLASPDEDDIVKRVIAVGGQTVECCDDQHRVQVDGKPLNEPYLHWEEGFPQHQEAFEPVTVPQGFLFVMGDNRNVSYDSREQGGGGQAGLVPVDNVIGKARVIVLPPSRWNGIGDDNPQALAMSAPAWQSGIPLGVGAIAAYPTLWLGRRVRTSLRRGRP
ncbi:signal peptidase I [Herbihabitans rhizosphaerae]|uniref:Signal peptidase I n=1 Tax=Herbihabitans rhizosphaerae TaxID=1872711 RepID=A0A4Q7KIC8_9PSEU|nr:signal peptidase I [Herbihabitans rhizosphaerae]RZS34670.1 signal peptidase I [Herbihabitans rhizosphaerae]